MQSHNHFTHDALINAARSGKKENVCSMLKTKVFSQETLYQVVKDMIPKKNKSQIDWEIIQLIMKDDRFNPDYHNESLRSARRISNENLFCFTANSHLIKIAIRHECYPSLNLLLNHPKINIGALRDLEFYKIAIEKNIFKTVNLLLRNPVFFALEKDWLAWADQHCPEFKIVFALNFCWHNWGQFTPDLINQGLCVDTIHEVAKNLCHVSLFAKKDSAQADANHPLFKCGHALC